MVKVLVTDADYKHTLGIVRLLGKRGFDVYVINRKKYSYASTSRFCKGSFVVKSSPKEDRFVDELERIVADYKFDVLLPVGFNSSYSIIKNKKRLSKFVKIPTVDFDTFEIAAIKSKTFDFVKKNLPEVNIPKTIEITSENVLKGINSFPVFLKASEEAGGFFKINNKEELFTRYFELKQKGFCKFSSPIVQEFIPGKNGFGFYAFYWHGKLISFYIHERIHMFPESGGPSTLAKTTYIESVFRQGKMILDALKWHGVAMVEFKKSEHNGKYYLIEINPKYWGSLDLGITAGAEFPYYHVMYSLGNYITPKKYKKDIYFMWPEAEILRVFSGKNKFFKFLRFIIDLLNPQIKKNVWLSDLKPTLYLFFAKFLSKSK